MPEVRPLPQLRRWYLIVNLLLMGTALLTFVYLYFQAAHRDWIFWSVAGLFVTCVVLCLVADRMMIRSIQCPSCAARLPRAKSPTGKFVSVMFVCDACQIIWDTEAKDPSHIDYADPL